jgi:hypothetical protein
MAAIDPITAVFNALSEIAGGAKPFINDYMAQKYDKEHRDRLAKWQDILSDTDFSHRADAIQSYIVRLLSDAGASASGVGNNIAVPLDALTGLVNTTSAKIKDDKILANFQFGKDQ